MAWPWILLTAGLAAGCLPLMGRFWPRGAEALLWVSVAMALGLPLPYVSRVFAGEVFLVDWAWVPSLGLSLSFRLDALALVFIWLVAGIGGLVFAYARSYFRCYGGVPLRFNALMLAFMTAMLGLVLSENLLLMVVFWEMTSLFSFLLIGFHPSNPSARRGARMALLITASGGLCLLAGVVWMGWLAGGWTLSDWSAAKMSLLQHPQAGWALGLILLGALTKSAQFPFHLWLPNAMAAPTPVSAYLHSATLVKVGIFLLLRLHPVFAEQTSWLVMLVSAGLVTWVVGGFVAMFMQDIKGLLAYSSVAHLGLLTLMLGLGSPLLAAVALFHLLAHALFKAPLFMMAGLVERATGHRQLPQTHFLARFFPGLMALTLVASVSMAGLPWSSGYWGKKWLTAQLQAGGLNLGQAEDVLIAGLILAGVFSLVYAWRLVRGVFFSGQSATSEVPLPTKLPWVDLLPLWLLVLAGLGLSLFAPVVFVHWLVPIMAPGEGLEGAISASLESSGWLTGLTLLLAVGLVTLLPVLMTWHQRLPTVDAKTLFELTMRRLIRVAQASVYQLENGSLQRYLALLLGGLVALVGFALWLHPPHLSLERMTSVDWALGLGFVALLLTSLGVVFFHRQRLLALLLLGVNGLIVTLFFARYSAPDLALTQVSIEIMAVVIMMLALSFLPQTSPIESSFWRRTRDAGLAILLGGVTAWMSFALLLRPHQGLAEYFLAHSLPGGGGGNVVNVILVDFRGFDTLGEITVLAIAAVAVFAFTKDLHLKDRVAGQAENRFYAQAHPMFVSVTARLVLPLALMMSAYIFLRGHDLPGGGFIAGLITAVALTLQYMAGGLAWAQARMRTQFRPLMGVGLLLALFTGLASLGVGQAFLTSATWHWSLPWIGELHLASALVFDLGVYAVVVGATLLILANLGRLMTTAGPGQEIG